LAVSTGSAQCVRLPCSTWPAVGSLRGKILFVADPGYTKDYLAAFPELKNATIFASDDSDSDDPNVVFLDVQVGIDRQTGGLWFGRNWPDGMPLLR
jgi:hypothetical protein